jgi:hypothetical protein
VQRRAITAGELAGSQADGTDSNGDEFGGGIAASGQFNRTKGDDVGHTGTDYLYSSTHDQGGESFGDRIGSMALDKARVGGNAKGLDAVTWLAAEGARFAPVAALGSAGSPESRYFIKPNPDWAGYEFLTTSDLMQSCPSGVYGLAWDTSGRLLAIAGEQAVAIWEAGAGDALARFPHGAPYAHRVAWAPDGTFVAASLCGDRVRLWETRA